MPTFSTLAAPMLTFLTTHKCLGTRDRIEPVLLWQKSFHLGESMCSVFHGFLDFSDGVRLLWT